MAGWERRQVQLRFQLSDRTLFTRTLDLSVRGADLSAAPIEDPQPPAEQLAAHCAGWLVRSLPVRGNLPILSASGQFMRYVPSSYMRYYIDLQQSFEHYKQKFSAKSRSTLQRKVRRWSEYCGGEIAFREYRSADELAEFHGLARTVSRVTYQERLLDAGLPGEASFVEDMIHRGRRGDARGYLLFFEIRPVAYLYCPVDEGVLAYAYLGYDPEFAKWSVGSVLQWMALERIFRESRFRIFDFTEGESEHKRLFATGGQECADVYFLRRAAINILTIRAHRAMQTLSVAAGRTLDLFGWRAGARRLLRLSRP